MIKIGIANVAARMHVAHEHFTGGRTVLFESAAGETPGPQAFLVEQPPDFRLSTHYHRQEQFQVVVRGSGTLASHPLSAIAVHYSSREAGYGPIVSGSQGLDYLTLRLVSEAGAQYLPEKRDGLRRGLRKSHATVLHTPRVPADASLPPAAHGVVTLIAPRDDGLAAWSSLVPAGQRAEPPGPVGGSGRFHVVVGGAFMLNGTRLPYSAAVYASNDEEDLAFMAIDGPAELLTLQFPDGADRDDYALAQQRSASSTAG